MNLFTPDLLHEGVWEDTEQQREWYDRGLIFLTKQKAIDAAHAVYTYIKGRPK